MGVRSALRRSGRQAPGFAAGVVVTAAVLAAPLAVAASTSSALPSEGPGGDRTAPSLTVVGDQGFVVGGQLDLVTARAADLCDARIYHFAVPVTWGWTTSDVGGSGLAGSEVRITLGNNEIMQPLSTRTSYSHAAGTDMDSPPCGGGYGPMIDPGYLVTAKDRAGNATTVGPVRWGIVRTNQEDGTSGSGGFPMTVKRWGTFTSASSATVSAGRTFSTSTLGSGIEFGVTTRAGQHLALVMSTGPTRGRADIRVDDVVVGRIDTYAATARDRVVVWERALTAGAHRVSVTNLATTGRPRIDVDEVLSTS